MIRMRSFKEWADRYGLLEDSKVYPIAEDAWKAAQEALILDQWEAQEQKRNAERAAASATPTRPPAPAR